MAYLVARKHVLKRALGDHGHTSCCSIFLLMPWKVKCIDSIRTKGEGYPVSNTRPNRLDARNNPMYTIGSCDFSCRVRSLNPSFSIRFLGTKPRMMYYFLFKVAIHRTSCLCDPPCPVPSTLGPLQPARSFQHRFAQKFPRLQAD